MLKALQVLLLAMSPVVLWEISHALSQTINLSRAFIFYALLICMALAYGFFQQNLAIRKPQKNLGMIWASLFLFLLCLIAAPLLSLYLFPTDVETTNTNFTNWFYIIIFVPIIEEYIFRKQLSTHLQNRFTPKWVGSYLSVFIFSFAHTQPLFADIYALSIGLALGPLFVGLVSEYLTSRSKSILPAIVFHALCNASGFIFGVLDSRWLGWLKDLYSHG